MKLNENVKSEYSKITHSLETLVTDCDWQRTLFARRMNRHGSFFTSALFTAVVKGKHETARGARRDGYSDKAAGAGRE